VTDTYVERDLTEAAKIVQELGWTYLGNSMMHEQGMEGKSLP
jgi:hypothetical protein